ncbi:MAG: FAD-dependent oxidoreductase [Actinomycetota bacterium]|nr:FAD-dependent oxidoreductase [Actinomycetota bacterium]
MPSDTAAGSHPHLLSPVRVGPMELRNRIVLPAMDQNVCDDGLVTDALVDHYAARARGGAGLLVLETSAVAFPHGATARHQPALSHDGVIPGLSRLAEAVHVHGARMVVQANHHGRISGLDTAEDRPSLVPSLPLPDADPMSIMADTTMDELMAMANLTGGKMPSYAEATVDDLAWVVGQFADAAFRVRAAGMDGIEVHAAHGYLIDTFLSPAWNRRTDAYGGSEEGRARLLVEIVEAVRDRCGPDFVILVRLNGRDDALPGGITPDLAARYAARATAAGADAIHVTAYSSITGGPGFTEGPLPWQDCQYEDLARTVKAAVDVPVIAVGRIRPDDAERILTDGGADLIAMGRQLLADADLPNRLAEGRPDLVRPCINCFVCVAQNFWSATPVCAVNAELGRHDRPRPAPVDTPGHVVVVGGGPGGLEAARVAAGRGHRVTVLDRADHLGGTARFSSLTTPMNGELVRWLSTAVAEAGADVQTGTTATAETVAALEPTAVVVATGAVRTRPDVPGANLPHVLSGDDLRGLLTGEDLGARRPGRLIRLVLAAGRLLGITDNLGRVRALSRRWMPIGRRVVIVGGGLVGTELAEFFAERGRTVTVLEEGTHLAVEMAHPRRWRALHEARARGVEFRTSARLVAITPTEVVAAVPEANDGSDAEFRLPADAVLLAGGVGPDPSLAEDLGAALESDIRVYVVGDAGEVGYIEGAIRSGHDVGCIL